MTSTSKAPPPMKATVMSPPCCTAGGTDGEGAGLGEPVTTGAPVGVGRTGLPLGAGSLAVGLPGATLADGAAETVGWTVGLEPGCTGRWLGVGAGVGSGGGVTVPGAGVGAPVQVMLIVAGQLAIVARTVRVPDTGPNDTVVFATPLASVMLLDGLT